MMTRTLLCLAFLAVSNVFMTFAWYGHLHMQKWFGLIKPGLLVIILISWGVALFEYAFQVPANRIGFKENGGMFSTFELKTIQEVISLVIFLVINTLVFQEKLQWNHLLAFFLILLAVVVAFKKW